MTARLGPTHGLALALLVAGCAARPPDRAAPVPVPAGDSLAVQPFGPRFEEARALAADPAGRLYVADAGASTVVTLTPEGLPLNRLGGPGTGDYPFLDPEDVDPTNGLVLVVADAGNGRIQRFSSDGRLLETLRVPATLDETDGPRSSRFGVPDDGGDPAETGGGRPVAVASAVTGEVFAVDELRGVVLRWSDRERSVRVVGGIEAGEGALREPVGLALAGGRLFVADRGHGGVLVYDAFGSYLRRIAGDSAPDLRAVAVVGDRLVLVLPRRLLVYGLDGRQRRVLAPSIPEPLVGVAGTERSLVLLTPTRLYRADLP